MEKYNQDNPTIASLVQKAMMRNGLKFRGQSPLQKIRRGRSNRDRERERIRIIKSKLDAEDDSGYSDQDITREELWNKLFKREVESDQQIFNIVRQQKIATQDKKVVFTTSICVPDFPDKADQIEEYSKHVKPVLSKVPKSSEQEDPQKKDKIFLAALHEAAQELQWENPRRYRRQELVELWLERYQIEGLGNHVIDPELVDSFNYGSGLYGSIVCDAVDDE